MMFDFETLMNDIFLFANHKPSEALIDKIKNTAENQRSYKSKHKYDLSKFGLSKEKIKKDCKSIYETFLTQ